MLRLTSIKAYEYIIDDIKLKERRKIKYDYTFKSSMIKFKVKYS